MLHDETDYADRKLIMELHAGTIFLGTPHPTYNERSRWTALSLLLQHSLKLPKHIILQTENNAAAMANISLKFEEAGILARVLSLFETQPSKVSSGKLRTSTRKEIVCVRIFL